MSRAALTQTRDCAICGTDVSANGQTHFFDVTAEKIRLNPAPVDRLAEFREMLGTGAALSSVTTTDEAVTCCTETLRLVICASCSLTSLSTAQLCTPRRTDLPTQTDALIRARAILADPQHHSENVLMDAADVIRALDIDPQHLADAEAWLARLTPAEATNASTP